MQLGTQLHTQQVELGQLEVKVAPINVSHQRGHGKLLDKIDSFMSLRVLCEKRD
jgi:hypothetical protein